MASIEWRGSNSCRIIVSNPKPNGRGYVKETKSIKFPASMTDKQKQKEAEKAAVLFEEQVKNGKFLDGEKITLAEFTEIWLKEYAEKELKPSTLVHYISRLNSRIIPALGHMKLARIQPHHITAFYNNLKETGVRMDVLYKASDSFLQMIDGMSQKSLGENIGVERHVFARLRSGKCVYHSTAVKICAYFNIGLEDNFIRQGTEKTLSKKTLHHHHTLLSGIFSTAVRWNVLMDNPILRVKLPSVTKDKKKLPNYYDDRQLLDLFMALENEPKKYKTIIYLAIDTGLRLSEVAGLKWEAIDFENQTLNVVIQRQYVSGHGIVIDDPKTDSGARTVTLSNMVTRLMTEYRDKQKELQSRCVSSWYQSDFIFTHENGKPMFPHRPSVWFTEFIKRNELPHITFHGLRHTNASLMISSDIDIVTISGRLGHADKSVTLNTYSHMIKSREKMAANKMDKYYEAIRNES